MGNVVGFEQGKVRGGATQYAPILLHSHPVSLHPAWCSYFERLLLLTIMPQLEQVEVSPASGRYARSLSMCT